MLNISVVERPVEKLPVSPVFIDFLSHWLDRFGFSNERWPDQRSEALYNSRAKMQSRARWRLQRIMSDESGQQAIENVYQGLSDLVTGRLDVVKRIHERYQFLAVVGIPRTGGSYLTAEFFCALGYEPTAIPAAVAHDGFPDAQPTTLRKGNNTWLATMLSMSEYLTTVELFFSAGPTTERIYVPKKLTKAVYAGDFFNMILGETAEYFITIRHPIAACISTYEKSGGLPADGRIKARSTIEKWIKRDLVCTGVAAEEFREMEYFTAYVRYWEQYYISFALSGLATGRQRKIIPFSKHCMEETAQLFHTRFKSGRNPTEFVSSVSLSARHPQWIKRGDEALERVAAVWRLVGLPFPASELALCS
jgi:hypothetical protein